MIGIHPAGIAGIVGALWSGSAALSSGALSFANIGIWTGASPGPGVAEAALVVDWGGGVGPQVWGYRWDSTSRRTGWDLLASVAGVDSRLHVLGSEGGFVSGFGWDGDRDGTAELRLTFDDRGTPEDFTDDHYWNFSVNNEVWYHPDDFTLNSHIVPPATSVVPLGNPYADANPAPWVQSSTGPADRELADGSWDGWAYGPYLQVPAEPVPEPTTTALAAAAGMTALLRRRRRRLAAATAGLAAGIAGAQAAGPYPPGPGSPGTDAIPADSPLIVAWATGVAEFARGPMQAGEIATPASYGTAEAAFGPSDALLDRPERPSEIRRVVSLGDGGSIVLTFDSPVTNGPGPDFAVFENAFRAGNRLFAELAVVEVSSDGAEFVRFPPVSLTPVESQVPSFGTLDPRDLWNLAGRHPAGFGAPFDLEELADASPGLNVDRITHIRIVDVVGSLNPEAGTRDAAGRPINDPFPSPYHTGGFDLDAVGVLHRVAPAAGWDTWLASAFPDGGLADPEVSGPLSDPDGDGAANLVEYAFGGDPTTPDAARVLPRMAISADGSPTLTFSRLPQRRDIALAVDFSADMQSWTVVAQSERGEATAPLPDIPLPVAVREVPGGDGEPVAVEVSVPSAGDRGFLRLSVTQLSEAAE